MCNSKDTSELRPIIIAIFGLIFLSAISAFGMSPITCPDDITAHWGVSIELDIVDLQYDPYFAVISDGPGTIDSSGYFSWQTTGDDVGEHEIRIDILEYDSSLVISCSFNICLENDRPEISYSLEDTLYASWGTHLSGQVEANDPDGGPHGLYYSIIDFDGPIWYGSGLQINADSGEWTWATEIDKEYLGDFRLAIEVTDNAIIDSPCSFENADTAYYNIHMTGCAVSIKKIHDQIQGRNSEVSIYLDSNHMADSFNSDFIGGFDLLIAYGTYALTALRVTPGELIDNGDFEYFTYRFGPFGGCEDGCPSGMIRIVGIRETNDGVANNNHITGPGELAKIEFYVSTDRTLECTFVPIQFYWNDCGDNVIVDETGELLKVGKQVYDNEMNSIFDPELFGYTGPMADCFDTVYSQDDIFKTLGSIVFYNGGIDIICCDSIDGRGDVNLNGIANEIADYVIFFNYFLYGLSAFTINVDGQIAATEINGDGYVLTVADLVYLSRIIIGDALSLPAYDSSAFADFMVHGYNIEVNTNVPLGAVAFTFEGNVNLTLGAAAQQMDIDYNYDGQFTRGLIYSLDMGHVINSGQILYTNGAGTLIAVETAEYRGTRLHTTLNEVVDVDSEDENLILPNQYAIYQNIPNPFNPTTTLKFNLPRASDVKIVIYNLSGQRVSTIVNQKLEGGFHSVVWDGSKYSSGIYFYQIQADDFIASKKMVLLK